MNFCDLLWHRIRVDKGKGHAIHAIGVNKVICLNLEMGEAFV